MTLEPPFGEEYEALITGVVPPRCARTVVLRRKI